MDIIEILNILSVFFIFFWLFIFPFLLGQIFRDRNLFIVYTFITVLPLLLIYFSLATDPLCHLIPNSESDRGEIVTSGLCKSMLWLLQPIIVSTIGGIINKIIIFHLDYKQYKFNRKLVTIATFTCCLALLISIRSFATN